MVSWNTNKSNVVGIVETGLHKYYMMQVLLILFFEQKRSTEKNIINSTCIMWLELWGLASTSITRAAPAFAATNSQKSIKKNQKNMKKKISSKSWPPQTSHGRPPPLLPPILKSQLKKSQKSKKKTQENPGLHKHYTGPRLCCNKFSKVIENKNSQKSVP